MHVFSILAVVAALLAGPSPGPDPDPVLVASQVLHAWDARREAAWAASDAPRLRGLYAAGSAAAGADVRLLRSYADRGLVVRRIVTQVFALRVLHLDARSLRLWVVDRVAGGAVGSRGMDAGSAGSLRKDGGSAGSLRKDEVLGSSGSLRKDEVRSPAGSLRKDEAATPSGSLRKDEVLSRRARPLGTTRPRARVIAFRRVGDDWRVVSVTVRAPPRGPP